MLLPLIRLGIENTTLKSCLARPLLPHESVTLWQFPTLPRPNQARCDDERDVQYATISSARFSCHFAQSSRSRFSGIHLSNFPTLMHSTKFESSSMLGQRTGRVKGARSKICNYNSVSSASRACLQLGLGIPKTRFI